jgi:mRNA interferase MazF
MRRGDVWLADLDPVRGSEQGKTRPVLIVQNDIGNEFSPVVIIAAITSAGGKKEYPTDVLISAPEGGLKKDSLVLLNQIRTVDKRRLIEHWGTLSDASMELVGEAIRISLGFVDL